MLRFSGGKRARLADGAPQLKPVSEWSVADVAAEEQPLYSHLSVLHLPRKTLTGVLELYHKTMDAARKSESRDGAASSSSSSRAAASSGGKREVKAEPSRALAAPGAPAAPNAGIPILVVPAALSSLINMFNVKQLLENGTSGHTMHDTRDEQWLRLIVGYAHFTTRLCLPLFCSFVSGELLRQQSGGRKPLLHTITRSSFYDSSKSVTYHVVDDVSQLRGDADWNRVVGVFVSGAAWQFADWPKSKWANPAAIFENVAAFHLHFDDEPLHPNVTQWRTHRLPISKSKRHGDRGVVLDFWRILTEFVAARNSTKRLNI